ncbi:hypothetical protein [Kaistella antarctica]|uniref:Uncharacterized protein n=1 Tax=Kaistella antarctica TaxID=266748 RepID=A0A3S4YJ67_9FLAO|nr:hypothetical protein [Kaistella antarctica]KEY19290.1 hypothetical protein HY04_12820 [Kaistella antarctica]SEW05085.1 hypothetical protein SAMN05421765_2003 [Kaistella antarctica]VEH98533.1 Uncharacterised protein [Kaistella antarctica]
MKSNLLLIFFLTFTSFLFGQDAERIAAVRKKVEAINTEKSYQIKKLDNDYFVNVKNEATDGGQELSGYYKNGKLKKIVYSVGLSYGLKTSEYFFSDDELIFVFEKQDQFAAIKDKSNQVTGLNHTKPEPVYTARFYFENSKLFSIKQTGKEIFTKMDKKSKEAELLKDCKIFRLELQKAKSR